MKPILEYLNYKKIINDIKIGDKKDIVIKFIENYGFNKTSEGSSYKFNKNSKVDKLFSINKESNSISINRNDTKLGYVLHFDDNDKMIGCVFTDRKNYSFGSIELEKVIEYIKKE